MCSPAVIRLAGGCSDRRDDRRLEGGFPCLSGSGIRSFGGYAEVELEVAAIALGVDVEPTPEATFDELVDRISSFSTRRSACCFVSTPSSTLRRHPCGSHHGAPS
jgi:hypothetical protein